MKGTAESRIGVSIQPMLLDPEFNNCKGDFWPKTKCCGASPSAPNQPHAQSDGVPRKRGSLLFLPHLTKRTNPFYLWSFDFKVEHI